MSKVFKCGQDVAGLYILGQLAAAVLAMSVFAFVSGLGPLLALTIFGTNGSCKERNTNAFDGSAYFSTSACTT